MRSEPVQQKIRCRQQPVCRRAYIGPTRRSKLTQKKLLRPQPSPPSMDDWTTTAATAAATRHPWWTQSCCSVQILESNERHSGYHHRHHHAPSNGGQQQHRHHFGGIFGRQRKDSPVYWQQRQTGWQTELRLKVRAKSCTRVPVRAEPLRYLISMRR